jgi:hypothetical protein
LDIRAIAYPIDAVAGSTLTHNAIMDAAEGLAEFFTVEILGEEWARPEPVAVDDATLLLAFPGGVTFTSIYLDNPFNENIVNIYEVKDGLDVVQGVVYIGEADGNNGTIRFAWGIKNDGSTSLIEIISGFETWNQASYEGYDESQGTYFPSSPWLAAQFEGVVLAEVLTTNPIDTVAGVSTTTDGMTVAAEAIAQYHSDNSVGGGS